MSATGDRSVPSPEHITHRPRWERDHSAHFRGQLTYLQLPAPQRLFSRKGRRIESDVPVWYTCLHTPVCNLEKMKEKGTEQHTSTPHSPADAWLTWGPFIKSSSLSPGAGLSSQPQAPARALPWGQEPAFIYLGCIPFSAWRCLASQVIPSRQIPVSSLAWGV